MRVLAANDRPYARRGQHVLYWMIAARRTRASFALDHALALSRELGRPLLVVEALRAGYRWASDRLHAFVLQGMEDNARAFATARITYFPYVESREGAGAGLIEALAKRACAIVTDEQPGFFLPRMVAALAARVAVRVDMVDGNGLVPMRAFARAHATAASFRREWQRAAYTHLADQPALEPLAHAPRVARDAELGGAVVRRWGKPPPALSALPIDHSVAPVVYAGGAAAAAARLDAFIADALPRYAADHAHPDRHATSGLSPYLHFGHISVHEIAARVWQAEDWDLARLAPRPTGRRRGWWGMAESSEAFLDELVTWRELAYGFCFHRQDYDRYSALPAWARATLRAHVRDPRPERYRPRELAEALTADPVWNAAQRELLIDGRIHGYLRMLWGKRILEWSPTPQRALATMIELNNRFAVDGRDPSSYGGIAWTLGLFDRPWGPERPIFGTVRYMSSRRTVAKLDMSEYLARWSPR